MSPVTSTNTTATAIEAIEQAFQCYLDVYFTQRDLAGTLARLSPVITGFGTGRDETAMTFATVSQLYRRDIEQAPNPITYRLRRPPHIHAVSPDLGLVSAELDLHTTVLDQAVSFQHLRLSLVFVQRDNDWLIEHMHLSLPTQVHGDDEAYPLKELEARNPECHRRSGCVAGLQVAPTPSRRDNL